MNPREFQIETERRLQTIDPTLIADNKLTSDSILSLLNEAIDKFVKTRYSGLNSKNQGFEQSQKRIDDLRTLVTSTAYNSNTIDSSITNQYIVTLPDDYVLLLGDTAGIAPKDGQLNNCWELNDQREYTVKYTDTLESTIETIDRQKQNTLSEHRLKYCSARPLKLIKGDKIYLFTDDYYQVKIYTIDYLRKPSKLSMTNALIEYTDLPAHTHIEIVKIAVQLYCATRSLNNYNSISNEVNQME